MPAVLAEALDVSPERAAFVYRDIQAKRDSTRFLHTRPILLRPVDEVRPIL